MRTVTLSSETDFGAWKAAARDLRLAGVPPEEVLWSVGGEAPSLFGEASPTVAGLPGAFTVPRAFAALAREVILHRSADRFDLLYRLLWRLKDEPAQIGRAHV